MQVGNVAGLSEFRLDLKGLNDLPFCFVGIWLLEVSRTEFYVCSCSFLAPHVGT
jgi:hypothetical protein